MHSHIIDTSTSSGDSNSPISAAKIEEMAKLSCGEANRAEEEENLVTEESTLTSDRSGINENNNLFRIASALALSTVGAFAVILMVSFYGRISGGDSISNNTPEAEPEVEETENELGNAKAELAISKQEGDLQPQLEFIPEEEPEEPEPEPEPKPEPVVTASQPRPAEPEPEVAEPPNPLEEWARLQAIGVSTGNSQSAVVSLNKANPDSNVIDSGKSKSNSLASRQTKTRLVDADVSKTKIEDTVTPSNSSSIQKDKLDNAIDNGEIAKVASVSIGGLGLKEETKVEQNAFDANSPAVVRLLSEQRTPTPTDSYLERKKKQYEEEDRLTQLENTGVASIYSLTAEENIRDYQQQKLVSNSVSRDLSASTKAKYSEAIDKNEESFLERKKKEFAERDRLDELSSTSSSTLANQTTARLPDDPAQALPKSSVKQVPLGAVSEGEISTTIVWSRGVDSTQARGSINLTEPLLADDGSVALEANSSLIVEIGGIASNGLALLNVIAVSYEDPQGKLKQELLPPGAISINGKDNGPLLAQQTEDSGSTFFGQDVLIGLLGAGERGFEALNEPNDSTTISNDVVVRTSSSNNTSLANGAAEGVFATTKDRLEDRSDLILSEQQGRTPIYHLEAGQTVSIFVNSFLEIQR